MKNIVVLVDANVILDYVTTREPYYHDADRRLWLKKILQALQVTGASHESVLRAVDMDHFADFEEADLHSKRGKRCS